MNEETKAIEENEAFYEVMPVVDILEGEDAVTMWFEVPGANSESVDIEVKSKIMTVEAKSVLRRSGRKVIFKREFQLSDAIDIDGIKAATKDGVLSLTLPKSEGAKVHKIKVA